MGFIMGSIPRRLTRNPGDFSPIAGFLARARLVLFFCRLRSESMRCRERRELSRSRLAASFPRVIMPMGPLSRLNVAIRLTPRFPTTGGLTISPDFDFV